METFWKVNTPAFFKEVASNSQLGPAAKGLEIMGQILFALADRIREVNDEELNSIACRLALFTQSDPYSKDFDKQTQKLIHKFDSKSVERIRKKF